MSRRKLEAPAGFKSRPSLPAKIRARESLASVCSYYGAVTPCNLRSLHDEELKSFASHSFNRTEKENRVQPHRRQNTNPEADTCDATDAPDYEWDGNLYTYDVLTCDGRGGQDIGTSPYNSLATQAQEDWANGQLQGGGFYQVEDGCWVLNYEVQNNGIGPNYENYNVLSDSMASIRDTQRTLAYNDVQQATSNSYGLILIVALAFLADFCG